MAALLESGRSGESVWPSTNGRGCVKTHYNMPVILLR